MVEYLARRRSIKHIQERNVVADKVKESAGYQPIGNYPAAVKYKRLEWVISIIGKGRQYLSRMVDLVEIPHGRHLME